MGTGCVAVWLPNLPDSQAPYRTGRAGGHLRVPVSSGGCRGACSHRPRWVRSPGSRGPGARVDWEGFSEPLSLLCQGHGSTKKAQGHGSHSPCRAQRRLLVGLATVGRGSHATKAWRPQNLLVGGEEWGATGRGKT